MRIAGRLDESDLWERSMGDLFFNAAIWQDEHWVDRSALPNVELSGERPKGAATEVLHSHLVMLIWLSSNMLPKLAIAATQ